jgi:hypothetical protein
MMTGTRIVGMILIVVGLVGLLFGGIGWTREKTVVDLGPIQAKTTEHKSIPIPPVAGGLVLAAGVVLMVLPFRRRV